MLVKNTGGQSIPAWGLCVQDLPATGTLSDGRRYIAVQRFQKPRTSIGSTWVYVNDSVPLAVDGVGQARFCLEKPMGWVACSGSPSAGQMWGPASDGDAAITENGAGFEIVGGLKNGRVLAIYNHAPTFYVQLDSALAAADPDLETGQKTATAHLLVQSGSGSSLSDATSQTITVTNRWMSVELDAGKKILVEWSWFYLEWIIKAAECPD